MFPQFQSLEQKNQFLHP